MRMVRQRRNNVLASLHNISYRNMKLSLVPANLAACAMPLRALAAVIR